MESAGDSDLILRQLTPGDGDPVLVAEFPAFSATPRLTELLTVRAGGRPVYQIDPLAALSQDRLYMPLRELAAACAGAFLDAGLAGGPVFVVGNCSAAALSLHVAQLLAGSAEVTAILLQPTWPDTKLITTLFAEFQANIGAAGQPCPDLDDDPRGAITAMQQILRDELAAVAASRGLGASTDAFADLLAWYRAWLAFLLACRNDPENAWATGAVAVKVLADSPADVRIPGLNSDAFEVSPALFADQENSAEAEHVSFVLEQIAARSAA